MKWKTILIIFAVIVIIVNFPLFNKSFLLMFDGKGHFRYSNSNASFTREESLGFKDPFISNWSIERFVEETHPAVGNKQIYRLYRINPFCFWRWHYYFSTSRNFEYKSWKEIEPNRAPYNPEDRWQDF